MSEPARPTTTVTPEHWDRAHRLVRVLPPALSISRFPDVIAFLESLDAQKNGPHRAAIRQVALTFQEVMENGGSSVAFFRLARAVAAESSRPTPRARTTILARVALAAEPT